MDPWGVRGFVNGFVHSWVRELVAGFVDWFTRFRVRGVSFPKASAKGSRCVRNYTGEKLHHRLACVPKTAKNCDGIDFKGFYVDFGGFWAGRV